MISNKFGLTPFGGGKGPTFSPIDLSPQVLLSTVRVPKSLASSPIFTVRRVASADEVGIYGFNSSGYYSTSAGGPYSDLLSSEDHYVKIWHDQSGHNYDASQTTPAAQPKLVLEGTTPIIDFNGTSYYLTISMTTGVSNFTFLFGIKQPNPAIGTNKYLFDSQGGSARLMIAYPSFGVEKTGYHDGSWKQTSLSATDWIRLSFILESGSAKIKNLNTDLATGLAYSQRSLGGIISIGSYYQGTANWFNGSMKNLMIFDSVITNANISTINDFFGYND